MTYKIDLVVNALPVPVLTIGEDGLILYVNNAAETFFDISLRLMLRQKIQDILPFSSPVLAIIDDVRTRGVSVSEYHIDIGLMRNNSSRMVDAFANPLKDDSSVVVLMLQERTIADMMNRQLVHRSAARSVTTLGAMLAHEIKNPLSGIKGAAQLLEQTVNDDDRQLTTLICDETERIVKLVERMELFGDERPFEHEVVNVHGVIDQVRRSAQSGFAKHIKFHIDFDPSLPPVLAHRDQLVQVFLNLVKNAAEALQNQDSEGEITLSTAYRTGISIQSPLSGERVNLPIELCVKDNGPGVPLELLPDLFDPFVTTKAQGSGLGLALVAKIIGDHGGIVECDPTPKQTIFRILLPRHSNHDGRVQQG